MFWRRTDEQQAEERDDVSEAIQVYRQSLKTMTDTMPRASEQARQTLDSLVAFMERGDETSRA